MKPAGGEGDRQGGREREVCVQGGEDGDGGAVKSSSQNQ